MERASIVWSLMADTCTVTCLSTLLGVVKLLGGVDYLWELSWVQRMNERVGFAGDFNDCD